MKRFITALKGAWLWWALPLGVGLLIILGLGLCLAIAGGDVPMIYTVF